MKSSLYLAVAFFVLLLTTSAHAASITFDLGALNNTASVVQVSSPLVVVPMGGVTLSISAQYRDSVATANVWTGTDIIESINGDGLGVFPTKQINNATDATNHQERLIFTFSSGPTVTGITLSFFDTGETITLGTLASSADITNGSNIQSITSATNANKTPAISSIDLTAGGSLFVGAYAPPSSTASSFVLQKITIDTGLANPPSGVPLPPASRTGAACLIALAATTYLRSRTRAEKTI